MDSFLSALDQSDEALQFFTKHQNFKGADKIVVQLHKLRNDAIQMLIEEFKNVLESANKKGIDPYNLAQPLEEGIELIPEDKLDRLSKIAQRLDSMNNVSYRSFYLETRSKYIRDAMAKIYPEKEHKIIDVHQIKKTTNDVMTVTGVNMVKNAMIGGIAKVTKSNKLANVGSSGNKLAKDVESKYTVKSSHKFILYMNFYLKLMEAERKICMKIVQGVQRHSVFSEVIGPSIVQFKEKAEYLANKNRTSEKVFVLLDVLETFESKLGEFDQVLQHTSYFPLLKELSPTFKKNISKLLEEFKNEVEKNEVELFKDGAVHQVTSNVRNVFDVVNVVGVQLFA